MTGVVISSSLVVNSGGLDLNENSPIIGYQNLVTTDNVTATTEDPDYPASNLANTGTHLIWRSSAGSPGSEEYLTVVLDTNEQVDYLAIARHNFGTGRYPISVEGLTDANGSPADWFELVSEQVLPDDGPVIFRFNPQALYAIRLKIGVTVAVEAPDPPELAVLFVGLLLVLQRRIYVGHTPLKYGREIDVISHRSINGAFLGRVILSRKNKSSVTLSNLTPSWYRSYLHPFILHAEDEPFFFAWRPGDYPLECGYAWLVSSPQPTNQLPNGMMQVALDMEGVV